jgi:hypothetical protein
MKYVLFAVFLLLSAQVFPAESEITAGTIIPAQLSSTIDSRKAHPGDRISARLMQDIDLGSGQILLSEAQLKGRILSVDSSHVTLMFDRITSHGREISLHAGLRSLASMMEVDNAQLPTNAVSGDYGSSILDWNTVQVGGEVAYGRGAVTSGGRVVGHTLRSGGVLALPEPSPDGKCGGALDNNAPQSFWIFSTSACGAYGFEDLTIEHAGETSPTGEITLTSPRRILVRSGSGILLRVVSH